MLGQDERQVVVQAVSGMAQEPFHEPVERQVQRGVAQDGCVFLEL